MYPLFSRFQYIPILDEAETLFVFEVHVLRAGDDAFFDTEVGDVPLAIGNEVSAVALVAQTRQLDYAHVVDPGREVEEAVLLVERVVSHVEDAR